MARYFLPNPEVVQYQLSLLFSAETMPAKKQSALKRKASEQAIEIANKALVHISPDVMQAMYARTNDNYHALKEEMKEACRRFVAAGNGSIMKQVLVTGPPLLLLNDIYDGEVIGHKFVFEKGCSRKKLVLADPTPANIVDKITVDPSIAEKA